ncbi:TPA: hypothetical protein DCW54_01235 [Candidatus Dependentiae bacterium]|nr:hypothetical protein [Candidatus Dependentiae bacterium]
MNISKWTYLFISLFVSAISYTHILPTDKKLIIIVYANDIEKGCLKCVQTELKKAYDKANDPADYKTFDEVFEIKTVSGEEFRNSLDAKPENIVCFFSDIPSRAEDYKPSDESNTIYLLLAFEKTKIEALPEDHHNKVFNNNCLFDVINYSEGKAEIFHLSKMIANIKEEKAEKKLEKASAISWKQAGLLTGGVTVVALGAYLMMRYNNQKSTHSSLNLNTDKNNVCNTAAYLLPADDVQLLIKNSPKQSMVDFK